MTADLLALLAAAHPNASPEQLKLMLDGVPDRGAKAPQKPTHARSGSRPRTDASMERRRSWAASGRMPARLAARFTLGEQAALALVATEVKKHGTCTLTVGHLAAVAGVSETTVRNAIRQAKTMGLVSVEEKRRTAWMSYPNTVRIVSPEWSHWLRLHGCKFAKATIKDSRKEDKARSMPNVARGFRSEEAAQAPGSPQAINQAQAVPRPDTASSRGGQGQSGMAGVHAAKGKLPRMQRRELHGYAGMRGT